MDQRLGRQEHSIYDKRGNSKLSNLSSQCKKVVRAGNIVVLDEKNPHIRNIPEGTVIKLDVNNSVYTMDMWICLDETLPVFS